MTTSIALPAAGYRYVPGVFQSSAGIAEKCKATFTYQSRPPYNNKIGTKTSTNTVGATNTTNGAVGIIRLAA